jgi:hypothetical protein
MKHHHTAHLLTAQDGTAVVVGRTGVNIMDMRGAREHVNMSYVKGTNNNNTSALCLQCNNGDVWLAMTSNESWSWKGRTQVNCCCGFRKHICSDSRLAQTSECS